MFIRFYFLAGLLFCCTLFAQHPFKGIEFGGSSDTVKAHAKNVSNRQNWDETAFELINPPYSLLKQFNPSKCILTYFKNRLYAVQCEFPRAKFEAIYTNLVVLRQVPKNREWDKADKSATWYGPYKENRFEDTLNIYQLGKHTIVVYTDETQKDFHVGDLFKGVLPWIILAIVGLFAGYMVFGWLMTSKCPKCKSRGLTITGKTFDNAKDYDPGIFSSDVHWDEVYHYKCKKCGYEKDDRHSSFWSWRRDQSE